MCKTKNTQNKRSQSCLLALQLMAQCTMERCAATLLHCRDKITATLPDLWTQIFSVSLPRCRGLGRFRVLFSFFLSQRSTRSFHLCGNLVHHIYLDLKLLTCFSNGFLQNLLLGHHPVSYNLFKLVSVWRVWPLLNKTHRCIKPGHVICICKHLWKDGSVSSVNENVVI